MIQHPLTINVEQAGRLLGIGRDAAYRAAAKGDIPYLKVGRKWRVPVARLAEMLGVTPEELCAQIRTAELTAGAR